MRDFLRRDAILVVDGQEILNYGRQSIPTFVPGHRLNSGPFGCMGVGLPFGVGAKVAKPNTQVVVLHGDGSYGINAMEIDTAVRHNIPVLVVISNNGGWTGDPEQNKPGRNLGYSATTGWRRPSAPTASSWTSPTRSGPRSSARRPRGSQRW